MTWVHRTLAVPLAHLALADTLTSTLAGPSGTNMWSIRLGASVEGPVTHYGASGNIQDNFASLLTDPATTHYLAQQAGLTCTLAEVEAVLAASLISDGTDTEGNAVGWEQVYASAGLYRVKDEE